MNTAIQLKLPVLSCGKLVLSRFKTCFTHYHYNLSTHYGKVNTELLGVGISDAILLVTMLCYIHFAIFRQVECNQPTY